MKKAAPSGVSGVATMRCWLIPGSAGLTFLSAGNKSCMRAFTVSLLH